MNLVPHDHHDKVPFQHITSGRERLATFTEEEIRILQRFIDSGFVHGLIEERVVTLEAEVAAFKRGLSEAHPVPCYSDHESRIQQLERGQPLIVIDKDQGNEILKRLNRLEKR